MADWLTREEIAALLGEGGRPVADNAVRSFLSRHGIRSVTHYDSDAVRAAVAARKAGAAERAAQHGTASYYYERKCRCEACRAAVRAYRHELAKRNTSHGNTTGYNRGCRCGACIEAGRDLVRRRKARKATGGG